MEEANIQLKEFNEISQTHIEKIKQGEKKIPKENGQ